MLFLVIHLVKQPSKSSCRRTGYKLECGEEGWRGDQKYSVLALVAKLADCGTLGCRRVGWKGLRTHLEYPMEKFLWHFVLRGGRFQGARAENTSAGTWMRGMVPMEHPPRVCVVLKPVWNLIPIFHTARNPRDWMGWHEVPLLKCTCLKAHWLLKSP